MSKLGDLIVEHDGPLPGYVMWKLRDPTLVAELRDELVASRAKAAILDRQHACAWNGDCEGGDQCPGCPPSARRILPLAAEQGSVKGSGGAEGSQGESGGTEAGDVLRRCRKCGGPIYACRVCRAEAHCGDELCADHGGVW